MPTLHTSSDETRLLLDHRHERAGTHNELSTIRDLYDHYIETLHVHSQEIDALGAAEDQRWISHIFTSRARVIPWAMIFITVGVAALVDIIERVLPNTFNMPMGILSLFGIPVGFLLTWRVTVSHARWWEGRNAWQTMETVCIDLTLQMRAWCRSNPALVRKATRSCAALLFAERHALQRPERLVIEDPNSVWEGVLLGGKWDRKSNPVFYATDTLRLLIIEAVATCEEVTPPCAMNMDAKVTQLLNAEKKIEILQRQPMPESYVVLLRTLLVAYLALVPFAAAEHLSAIGIVVFQFVISFALLGVEAAAAEIERPFDNTYNDVPVNRIVLRVVKELAEIEEKHEGGAASRDFFI